MSGGTTSVVGKGAPQPCKICGAVASFTNFGVVSCSSCKMFFKRNAEAVKNRFVCDLDNQCVIDVNSRRTCSACRLTKCFTSGMQIALIRSPRMHKNIKRKKKCAPTSSTAAGWHGNDDNQQLPTLNLLRADRSTLNIDQWTLLSNLIHCFDEPNELRLANLFIAQQSALPPKYRYKPEATAAFTIESSKRAQCVFERNAHYRSLCPRDRSTLFRCVVKHTGGMAGTFVLHQSRLLYDPSFDQTCRAVFGNDLLTRVIFLAESFDEDATLFKLIAASLTFSTMRYTDYDAIEQNNLTDVKRVLQIQDIYVDLAWRYMTYRYNEDEVVKRFSLLVRYLLRMINGLIEVEKAAQHNQTIDRILEKTDEMTIDE